MKTILYITVIKLVLSIVSIVEPEELRNLFKSKDNNISVSYANFGRIPYGYHIVNKNLNQSGKLYYDTENVDIDMACKPLNNFTGMTRPEIDKNPILLIER